MTKQKYFFLLLFLASVSFFAQSDINKEVKSIDSILKSIDTIKTPYKKTYTLTALAGKFKYSKNARRFINMAIEVAEQSNNPELLAASHYSLGNYYYFNLELDSSLVMLNKATDYIKNEDHPFLETSILTSKSGIYQKKGNYKLSISTKLEAKKVLGKMDTLPLTKSEKFKYTGKNLVLDNSLANLYSQLEDYEVALEHYDKAYRGALKIGRKNDAGVIISNKGDLLLNIGKHKEALTTFERGKQLKIEGKTPLSSIANSDANIGYAHSKLGNYKKATESFNTALRYYEEKNSLSGLVFAYIGRGKLYNTFEEYQNAVQDCEKAKEIAVRQDDLEFQLKSCECLFEAYKGLGDYKKSLQNHELQLKFKDSIFNEKNIKQLAQLEMQYDFDKKQELQFAEAEAKEYESKLYLFLALLGFATVLLLGFFFYKNKKKNALLAQQKQLLEIAVDEKNILLRETHHRVKNSFQIVSSLLYLQSENMEDKEAALAVKEAQNRVKSMVLIHQKLYSKNSLIGINTKEYITDLTHDIISNQAVGIDGLTTTIDVDEYVLSVDTITPIGLIINELITNVIKHAFPKSREKPTLKIAFKKVENYFLLTVEDNGVGFKTASKSTSFGLKLITALSKKLKATVSFKNENGTLAILQINKFEEV